MRTADEEINLIRDLLRSNPKGLTISEIGKALALNRVSAARYLDRLLYSGQAEMRKFGHASVYTLASRIPLSHLLDLSASPVAIVGPDFFIRHVNSRLLDTFNLKQEEMIGHQLQYTPWFPFLPETLLPRIKEALDGNQGIMQYSAGPTGKAHEFNVKLKPVTDEAGEICAAIILEDISLKKHYERDLEKMVNQRTAELLKTIEKLSRDIENQNDAKEALVASHRKYRSIVEDMPSYICCFEPDGTITYVNDNFCRFLEKEEHEILGQSITHLTTENSLSSVHQSLKTLNSDNPSITIVKPSRKSCDQISWQQWTCRAFFTKNGRVSEYQSIGIDITNRVHAEQALAEYEKTLDAIIRGSPLPQFVIDRNHTIVFWNTAMETFTGIPARKLADTRSSGLLFYEDERPLLADLIMDEKFEEIPKKYPLNCRRSGSFKERWEGITFSQIPHGRGTWVYFSAAAIRDGQGNLTHVVETMLNLMEYCTKDGETFVLNPHTPHVPPGV